ncbi:selenium binding protein [Halomonas sp. HL-93]|uniref:selenium binding protein n=1 Tax=Halomonas sp. HL-93 TaxID=1666906 RepID=UPI0007F087A6|nr:selenium binding protein [Halomonas sp. HL-93]SBR50880.1 hypothetical protein GA0071314_2911 [Halomonas sp. HL-93]
MYETYSRQSLPSKKYRELLGSAVCVFNSNNSFIIENILKNDASGVYSWYNLIDCTSGELSKPIKDTITKKSNTKIANNFSNIIQTRNRIMHSFQVTAPEGSSMSDDKDNQILATKYKNGKQEYITEEFLLKFIRDNNELSSQLHSFRGY